MKHFTTTVDTSSKSYVLAHKDSNLVVRVGATNREEVEDSTQVIFTGDMAALSGAAFDDLNVRVRAAREWLLRSRGNVETMINLLDTI